MSVNTHDRVPRTTASGAADAGDAARPRRGRRRINERAWAAAFLAPALIAIVSMRIAPTVQAFTSSLYRGFPGGLLEPVFTGFSNYQDLWANEGFRQTVLRTLVFNLVINPLQIALALLIAIVMTRKIHLRGPLRTLVFVPATVPIVGSSIVWGIALQPRGPVNAIIEALGGRGQPFFTSPDQALGSIILVASWIGIGYWMLFLIAGIHAIPEEYYEAAKLDRAGPVRTFFSVTIPLLKRPLLFVLVADTVANFVLFVPVQIVTGGGPQNSTTMQMFNAYRTTYTYGSKNLGAAEVVILTLIMLVFVAIQFRLLREERAPRRKRP